MVREKNPPDYGLLVVTMLLVACGIVFIYDASFVRAGQMRFTGNDPQFFLKRQLLWAGFGVVGMLVAMKVPYWKLRWLGSLAMPVTILLLMLVLTKLGIESHGARRWLGHGLWRFQPSEMAKIVLVLFLARWLQVNYRRVRLTDGLWFPALVMCGAALLIAKEPDLGTALVLAGTGMAMFFFGGARGRDLALMGGVAVLLVVILIILEPYRGERITTWLHPEQDRQGSGYQVVNSLIALGSGGPIGVGLGQGRQKHFYLPAEYTDYIVGTVGEELGLLGTLGILGLFFFVVARGLTIAHRTKDPFGSLLAGGLSATVGLQTLLNVGVATNLLPSTGVPLPFISYGGSSLVLAMVSMGMLMNIAQYPAAPEEESKAKDVYESAADRGWDRRARVSGGRRR